MVQLEKREGAFSLDIDYREAAAAQDRAEMTKETVNSFRLMTSSIQGVTYLHCFPSLEDPMQTGTHSTRGLVPDKGKTKEEGQFMKEKAEVEQKIQKKIMERAAASGRREIDNASRKIFLIRHGRLPWMRTTWT